MKSEIRIHTSLLDFLNVNFNLAILCNTIILNNLKPMNYKRVILPFLFMLVICDASFSQGEQNKQLLTIDRIYDSSEFFQERMSPITWIDEGDSYVILEDGLRGNELIKYNSKTQKKSTFLAASELRNPESKSIINVEDFSLSEDGRKLLLFTNSSRVWRSNTKGDYWVYDFDTKVLSQLGKQFPSSSLMFAKFSSDHKYVGYVQGFNIYIEEFKTGAIKRLTRDGNKDIINGTFDWVYEEEFGCRDGFRWSEDSRHIAFWKLDAAGTGVFSMINNTDSIYPKVIPIQYPKVGEQPSICKIGIVDTYTGETDWVVIPDAKADNYIPAIQWMEDSKLLIQQLNRHQNHLTFWVYDITSKTISLLYEEREDTWVDIKYPDITANGWARTDMHMANKGQSILRMTENDGWRHIYAIDIESGDKELITPGTYDVASLQNSTNDGLYFMASPDNKTQRYLFHKKAKQTADEKRITPSEFEGINKYRISPNGKYAIHTHTSHKEPFSARLISLPSHKTLKTFIGNDIYKRKLSTLDLPEIEFFNVTTEEGIRIDGRMIKPVDFDPSQKYPVLFHVYGEPWGQVAQDAFVGLWNIMLSQKGYIIIDMDNRGTPVLNGSEWRKSIYRKIGVINTRDQALAAKEVLKWDFIDAERTAVWGWSGGGSMTLNLMFQHPDIYKTGIAIAAVAYQLTYDNIYQERYMGLPQENEEDFLKGSPIHYAKQLEGNLLLIHGTADDNVHYQNAEMLINELVRHNKLFDLMIYPNRSHGIWEGDNTTRHLYSMMTKYLLEHCPVND